MKLQDMFKDDIERPINGVVKVDQDTDEVLRQEVKEYVITRDFIPPGESENSRSKRTTLFRPRPHRPAPHRRYTDNGRLPRDTLSDCRQWQHGCGQGF